MLRSGLVTLLVEDAGFLLTNLAYESTGVAGAVIWMAAGEFSIDDGQLGPRIVIMVGQELSPRSLAGGVAVTLSTPAGVIGALPEGIRGNALSCAQLNRDVFLAHWRGELDTRSAVNLLRPA